MSDAPLLLPDMETSNHLVAARDIRALPDGSDFSALLAREEARDRGPRPSVVRVIRSRLGPPADPAPNPAPTPTPTAARAPASAPQLPEAPWETRDWRGFPLYTCRHCGRLKTFDLGEAAEHAERHHPGK